MSIRKSLTAAQILERTDPEGAWYNDNKLVATGKHWLYETSPRGYGKSTRAASRFIATYICTGKKWLYLRRNDKLLNSTKWTFFDTAVEIINDVCSDLFYISHFRCETLNGITRYFMKIEFADEDNTPPGIEDVEEDKREDFLKQYRRKTAEECGLAMALSTGEEEAKSGGGIFKNVKLGVYDEFIAAHGTNYLGSADTPEREFEAIYSIYISVAREKGNPFLSDVYFFFLGNWSHDYNPILVETGVNIYTAQSPEAHMIAPKSEEWAIEFIEPTEGFKRKQRESVAYKLAQHSKREQEYNFENKSKDSQYADESICKDTPKDCRYMEGLMLNNKGYGVYYRRRDGLIYIGKIRQEGKTHALDIGSYTNGNASMLVMKWRDDPILERIYERFLCRKVYFRDKETQRAFLQYLDFIPRV